MPNLPTPILFYSITVSAFILCLITIKNKKPFFRAILFLLVLWLNAVKWNYNFFSHVGHLLVLSHFFGIFLGINNLDSEINKKAKYIRWYYFGIFVTYSMAGFWKLGAVFYKLIFFPNEIHWLHPLAVEVNAINSFKANDVIIPKYMLEMYEIPYFWEFCTMIVFLLQLFAVFAIINKKLFFWIGLGLIIMHLYNLFFIITPFYVAIFVLLIHVFPYHQIVKIKLHILRD